MKAKESAALTLVLVLGGALALAGKGRAGEPPALAIKDARIVVAPGEVLERATIVFRHGLIEAVGESVTAPRDALVEDGKGLTVYAGWIDAGAPFPLELGSSDAARAREGTPPATQDDPPVETPEARRKGIRPSLEVASTLLLDNDRRALERKGGFAVALAVPPRAFLAGTSAVLALGDGSRRASIVAPHTFLHASLHGPENFDWHGYPHSLMGAHAHIRQAFADAKWVRELEERAARGAPGPRPAFDPELEALRPALDGKLRVAWQVDNAEDAVRALALGRELGLKLCFTEARHAAKAAPLLRREGVPAIVSLAWGPKPKPPLRELDPAPKPRRGQGGKPLEGPFFFFHRGASGASDAASLQTILMLESIVPCAAPGEAPPVGPLPAGPPTDPTQETRAAFEERESKRLEEVNALRDFFLAGVHVAVSSAGLKEPAEVRERLREAIKAGLSEEAAVAALTRDAARVLGLEGKLGTLEPGKLGFATVLTSTLGDEKARVRWLVVDGEKVEVERAEEDAKLSRLAGRYAFETGPVRGTLVLEALSGKLGGRLEGVGADAAALPGLKLEGDRVLFVLPVEVAKSKKPVPVDARWVEADVLEGTATFEDGARVFKAKREPR